MVKLIDKAYMVEIANKVNNWGKWGENDQIGTLNYVTPECVQEAAGLIKRGKVFALGMNFDDKGPQTGKWGRVNPIHTMLYTGTDALLGSDDTAEVASGVYCADDYITMPVQCATHWDAVGHIFYKDFETGKMYMWNGYDPRNVDCVRGVTLCGIEHTRDRMVGRGVLLDVPRFRGVDYLLPGEGITGDELQAVADKQGVEIKSGDFVLIRTGDLGRRLKEKNWGTFNSGDAPGVEFESIIWMHDKEIAAVGMDTWGCEVRPNRTSDELKWLFQPWHWVCIPVCGLTMGEMFVLDELADDCARDGVYEFFFTAPPICITHGTGSPLNPQVIK